MRVLYVLQYVSTSRGAVGTQSYEFAKRLIACDHSNLMVRGEARAQTGLAAAFTKGRRRVVDVIEVLEFDLVLSNAHRFARRALAFVRIAFRSLGAALTESYDMLFATSTPLSVVEWFSYRSANGLVGLSPGIVDRIARVDWLEEVAPR